MFMHPGASYNALMTHFSNLQAPCTQSSAAGSASDATALVLFCELGRSGESLWNQVTLFWN